MCWSAKVSLITFLTSSAMCGYLWYRNMTNDRAIALWIFSFALIQFFEFIMWMDYSNSYGLNDFASRISLPLIFAQPLVLCVALLKYGDFIDTPYTRAFLYIVIAIALTKTIYTLYFAFIVDRKQSWTAYKGDKCHLVWHGVKHSSDMPQLTRIDKIYVIPLLLVFFLVKPIEYGLIYMVIGLITFWYSRILYGLEYASIWCWMANILALVAVISNQ
jgi:hypothetical protein